MLVGSWFPRARPPFNVMKDEADVIRSRRTWVGREALRIDSAGCAASFLNGDLTRARVPGRTRVIRRRTIGHVCYRDAIAVNGVSSCKTCQAPAPGDENADAGSLSGGHRDVAGRESFLISSRLITKTRIGSLARGGQSRWPERRYLLRFLHPGCDRVRSFRPDRPMAFSKSCGPLGEPQIPDWCTHSR